MKEIVSRNNETLKRYAALADKRERDREGLFLAEGEKLFFEGLARGKPDSVFLRSGEARMEEYRLRALSAGIPEEKIFVLSLPAFEKLADAKTPQGVIGAFRKPERKIPDKIPGHALVLDRISDPGNLGTLLRTAAATNIPVFLIGCTDPYSPKCVRSSMSGVFASVFYEYGAEETLALLRRSGTEVCAADMRGENFFAAPIEKPCAVVVGNEANGISEYWRKNADRVFSLPMENGIESLNAAVCGSAMLMYLKYSRR